MQLEMLLLTRDSIKKMGWFFIMLEGAYSLVFHFPSIKTNPSLRNPPNLHNNYCGSAQTINPSYVSLWTKSTRKCQ